MRLVACPACKTHLDVTDVRDPSVHCPCGTTVDAVAQEGVAGTVRRCAGCGASIDERATICGYCQSPIVREPRQLSLSCPECLARNPESGRFCTGCGTEFLPQAPQASSEPKPCPGCEEPLVAQQVRTVWLRACSWCDGLWVPARSLDALVRRMQDGAERALLREFQPVEALVHRVVFRLERGELRIDGGAAAIGGGDRNGRHGGQRDGGFAQAVQKFAA